MSGVPLAAAMLLSAAQPELVEHERVHLVRLPVVLEERRPGGCDGVRPEWIEVVEGGTVWPATHLDPEPLPAVHALLVDTSESMLTRLGAAREAALAYIDAVPDDEVLLLASFDDSLVLHGSFGTDRETLRRRVAALETGWGTALWDAVQQMVRSLASRSERKVLVVISDGCDQQRAEAVAPAEVIELAARTPSLTVFGVGIDLPSRCQAGRSAGDPPANALGSLARRTGGELYEPADASELSAILADVRRRIARERWISYAPRVAVEPAPGGEDESASRWRPLRVRFAHKVPCSIAVAGPRARSVAGDGANDGSSSAEVVVSPFVPSAPGRLAGRVLDVVRDSGPLFVPRPGDESRYSFVDSPRRLRAARDVEALVPPLARVAREDARPIDPLLWALEHHASAQASGEPAARWTDVRFIVAGRTLLELREGLAAGLARLAPYRMWAVERIRRERLERFDRSVGLLGEAVSPAALADARRSIADGPLAPTSAEWTARLGSWLGDLDAIELFGEVELAFASRLIEEADTENPDRRRRRLAEAEAVWARLAVWIPGPEDVRTVGLLVPGYDPSQQAIGFYRVVLPRPRNLRSAAPFARSGPLGVRLLAHLLSEPGVRRWLVERRARVTRVVYEDRPRQGLGAVLRRAGLDPASFPATREPGRVVRLALTTAGEEPVWIGGYALRDSAATAPACLLLEGDADETLAGLLEALAQRTAAACLVRFD